MKSLTSKQAEQLTDLQEKLQSASEEVESAIAQFNTEVSERWENLVLERLNDYNNAVEQAKEFVEERREQMQSYTTKAKNGAKRLRGNLPPQSFRNKARKERLFRSG